MHAVIFRPALFLCILLPGEMQVEALQQRPQVPARLAAGQDSEPSLTPNTHALRSSSTLLVPSLRLSAGPPATLSLPASTGQSNPLAGFPVSCRPLGTSGNSVTWRRGCRGSFQANMPDCLAVFGVVTPNCGLPRWR